MIRFLLVLVTVAGCTGVRNAPPGGSHGDDDDTTQIDAGSNGSRSCSTGECICPPGAPCSFDCPAGFPCDVQSGLGSTVSTRCSADQPCEVECSGAASCSVDCNGRVDCQVTCPHSACTVINIPANDPNITCAGSAPERTGTTARCL